MFTDSILRWCKAVEDWRRNPGTEHDRRLRSRAARLHPRALQLEPLEHRMLLAVASGQSGVEYSPIRDAEDCAPASLVAAGDGVARGVAQTGTEPLVVIDQPTLVLADGLLTITGTNGNDTIRVRVDGSLLVAEVNGQITEYALAKVSRITARGLAGNDQISLAAGVPSATLDGGEGDDVITGGDGDDTLIGGPGYDVLDGGIGEDVLDSRDGQHDLVRGGLGRDQAATDSLDEFVDIEYLNPYQPGPGNQPITVRVLVLNYDPLIPSQGNQHLWELFGWTDPHALATDYERTIERSSGGFINIDIVEWRELNEIPAQADGFRYTPDEYYQNRLTNTGWHDGGGLDYYRMIQEQAIAPLIESGQIDEVWHLGDHYFLGWEAAMAGPRAFYINGGPYPNVDVSRPFVVMAGSYERSVTEMVHNTMHRIEDSVQRPFGGWNIETPVSAWDRFTANYWQSPEPYGVGSTHFPANGDGGDDGMGYQYWDTRLVESTADDWLNYPNLTGATIPVSCETWSNFGLRDYYRGYHEWFLEHLPRAADTDSDGRQANWWKYIYDFDNYDPQTGAPRPFRVFAESRDEYRLDSNFHTVQVTYASPESIDIASIGDDDIRVTGPNGFDQLARFVAASDSTSDSWITATYQIAAPSGSWAAGQGSYEVRLEPGAVSSLKGTTGPAGTIAAFTVRTPEARPLENDHDTVLLLRLDDTLIGASGETPVEATGTAHQDGVVGRGMHTDSTGHVAYATDGNIAAGKGTVEFWINPDWDGNLGQHHTFFEVGDNFNDGMLIGIDGANNLRFIQWGDDPETTAIEHWAERGVGADASSWKAGEWRHLACSWDSEKGEMAMYVDGRMVGYSQDAVTIESFSTQHMRLGAEIDGSNPSLATFDEVRVSTRARSVGEIKSDFTSGLSIESIAIDAETTPLYVQEARQLQASGSRSDAVNIDITQQVQWVSGNPAVLVIDDGGLMHARSAGSATITATLGGLEVSKTFVVADPGFPTAALLAGPGTVAFGSECFDFVVKYSDGDGVNAATIGAGDVRVHGPNGFSQFASLVEISATPDGTEVSATYRVTPLGNYWNESDRGLYTVDLMGWQVCDDEGNFSLAQAITTLDLSQGPIAPIVSTLGGFPDPTIRPDSITLTAMGVSDTDGTVVRVEFYDGETLLGMDDDGADGWSLTVATTGWPLGEHTFSARAQDNDGAWSPPASTTVTVQNAIPVVTSLAATPSTVTRPESMTLTAAGVSDADGTVARVEFYRGDILLGIDEDASDGWAWTGSTNAWPLGQQSFSARAQDNDGAWSAIVATTATIADPVVAPAEPTAHEQYLLELINRGRLDPVAEAARYGIDLNEGLAPGTISSDPKQPLTFSPALIAAARGHSDWMLVSNTFSHTGEGGSSPRDRMVAAGYVFALPWGSGENIAARGTYGAVEMTQMTALVHAGLYASKDHRVNQMSDSYREVGLGLAQGPFTPTGPGSNALIATENFAFSGTAVFLTGVAYDDVALADLFYTPGEGLGGVTIQAVRDSDGQTFSTQTWSSGGYSLPLESGTYTITATGGAFGTPVVRNGITVANRNLKLDFTPLANLPPVITTLTAAPNPVVRSAELTLTAGGIADADGTVARVEFYRGQVLLGTDENAADGWSLTISTADWAVGEQTLSARAQDNNGAWSAAASATVTVIAAKTSLGTVDFRQLDGLSLAAGSVYYDLQTAHAGYLTLEVIAPEPPKSARIKLYNQDPLTNPGLAPLVTSTLGDANQRVDLLVASGETYYVELYGSNPDFDLRIANLVEHSGTVLTVFGTNDDDAFEFSAAGGRSVAINGVRYPFTDAQVTSVNFDGGAGYDTISLFDSPGDETLEAWPDHAVLTNPPGGVSAPYTVQAAGFEDMQSYATRGGVDKAILHGSKGGDKLKSYEDFVRLRAKNSAYSLRAKQFASIVCDPGSAGSDAAVFEGTDGDETFTYDGGSNSARMQGIQRDHSAVGFGSIIARAGNGENDVAYFTDRPRSSEPVDDVFYFKVHKTELVSSTVNVTARAFDEVHATASESGFDVARLYDTTKDEHFVCEGNTAWLYRKLGTQLDLLYEVIAFERVKVYGSGGNDTIDDRGHTFELYFADFDE